MQGTPDTLTINAGMEVVAPDAAGALNQTSQRQKAVIDALVGSGIDRKDINTSQVSVQPQYAGGDSTTISGYRATNTIDIKVRQLDSGPAGVLVDRGNGGDATRINNVTLAIEDDSQLVREARARAFNDAKSRAEQYALLAEMDLGKVISISEAPASTPPTPFPSTRGGAAEMAAGADRARPADRRLLGDGDLRARLARGRDVDRNAVEHRRARQRVECRAVVELVDVDAGVAGRDFLAGAARSWPHPCGSDTTPRRMPGSPRRARSAHRRGP